jgi:LysR family transcriptional regulator, glycine cleavage system transcriptional activator
MRRRLPPLSTLPVFEAASRLGSFSAAAEELHVTHGAVSHQIRSLEEHLGIALFARNGRRVALTPDGAAFAEQVRNALRLVGEAVESISPEARQNRLTISVLPSFASRWLMPHIGRFVELHPEYEISVQSTISLANFSSDGVDVAIRFGRGPWPGVHSERIAGDAYFPVCSPRFHRGKLPKNLQQLAGFKLLRTHMPNWELWFRAARLDFVPPMHGVDYDDASLLLQAAIAGEGIALTRKSLVENDLAAGRLVKLFDIEVASPEDYYLVCAAQQALAAKITAFRDWIVKEITWE